MSTFSVSCKQAITTLQVDDPGSLISEWIQQVATLDSQENAHPSDLDDKDQNQQDAAEDSAAAFRQHQETSDSDSESSEDSKKGN